MTWTLRSAAWARSGLPRSIGRPRDARRMSIRQRVADSTSSRFAEFGTRPEPGQWAGTRLYATAGADDADPMTIIRPASHVHSPLRDLKLIKGCVQAFLQRQDNGTTCGTRGCAPF